MGAWFYDNAMAIVGLLTTFLTIAFGWIIGLDRHRTKTNMRLENHDSAINELKDTDKSLGRDVRAVHRRLDKTNLILISIAAKMGVHVPLDDEENSD